MVITMHLGYGHCGYLLYNFPTFLEIWSGFTGTLRAPGGVYHPFEVRCVICSISTSRNAASASDG